METRAHYVLIGAFVLCAFALAFLFILWIGQTQREYDEYDVIFRDRVSGLSVGAQVSFNGIQKGNVSELKIDADNPAIVVARVRVDKDTPVKVDTRAELELVGFTGVAIIQFVGGSPDQSLLKDTVRGVPKIEASAGGIAQIFEGGNDIISAANRLLSDKNIEAFHSIVGNVDTFVSVFAEQRDEVGRTIQNLADITEDIAKATDDLEAASSAMARLLDEDAPDTLEEIDKTVAEARLLIEQLNAVVEENREPLAIFTNEGLAQTAPAMAEARRMFRTLDQILREVDRNPRGYLLGESTPEYEPAQ